MRRTTLGLLLVAISTSVLACASGAQVLRPKEGTAGDATGEKACDPKRVSGDSEPFAVDWSDTNRAALESSMQRGVAVVKYSCEGVEVLKGCSLAGDYAYRGMSKKTKLVQMKDMGAVAANFGPTTLPVAVQAELKQGKGLDLAYVMVGAESTTVQTVSRDMLKGRCDGATHFVYEANLGAFALDTSASGEGKVAAQVLGQGGLKTEASSSKSTRTTDGDVAACEKATDEGKAKTEGCKAVVRVTLFAIAAEAAKTSAESTLVAPDARTCPPGFSYVDGACDQAAKVQTCAVGDLDGCKTQCKAGSKESCGRLSAAIVKKVYSHNFVVNGAANQKAGSDAVKDVLAPLKNACAQGEAAACWGAAMSVMANAPRTDFVDFLPEDDELPEVIPLIDRGCKLGDSVSCYYVMSTYGDGMFSREKKNPVAKNQRKMIDMVGLACDRGNAVACLMLAGQVFNDDRNFPNEAERAGLVAKYAKRACTGGMKQGCVVAGAVQSATSTCVATFKAIRSEFAKGGAVLQPFAGSDEECPKLTSAQNAESAKEMFELGCKRGDLVSCGNK